MFSSIICFPRLSLTSLSDELLVRTAVTIPGKGRCGDLRGLARSILHLVLPLFGLVSSFLSTVISLLVPAERTEKVANLWLG